MKKITDPKEFIPGKLYYYDYLDRHYLKCEKNYFVFIKRHYYYNNEIEVLEKGKIGELVTDKLEIYEAS